MSPRVLALLVGTNVLGGASYAATAYALRGFSPEAVVFWRTAFGVLLFLPWLLREIRTRSVRGADWPRVAAVATAGYAAPLLIGTYAQGLSTATNASLLVGVEPVAVVVLSAFLLGEAFTVLKAAALACGLAGSALIVLQGLPFLQEPVIPHPKGDLLLILHGLMWSFYTLLAKPALRRIDPMTFTAVTTAISLPFIAIAAAPTVIPAAPPPWEAVAALAALGAGVSFAGTLTWNKALELVPASQLANFIFLQPVVGSALGAGLLGEPFTRWTAAGGVLILAGVWGASRTEA